MNIDTRAGMLALLLALPIVCAAADTTAPPAPDREETRVMAEDRLDAQRLEKELQGLNWEQFRSVVEAVPKLKTDVDAYGPAGWEYVKGKYKTYAWHKNIDRMDGGEKQKLAALIAEARDKH